MGDPYRTEVNTEVLYSADEHRLARQMYDHDHPNGSGWANVDKGTRGVYLEKGGQQWIQETFGTPPE